MARAAKRNSKRSRSSSSSSSSSSSFAKARRREKRRKGRSYSRSASKDRKKKRPKSQAREKSPDSSSTRSTLNSDNEHRRAADQKKHKLNGKDKAKENMKDKQKNEKGDDKEKKGKVKENGAVGGKPSGGGAGAAAGAAAAASQLSSLGNLDKLRQQLDQDRTRLQLFVLKAKQEHEDKQETLDKRASREKEYYKASFGEPCGPGNRFLLDSEIGKGAFSSVYKCQDIMGAGDKEFAIKFIRKNVMLRQATEKEVRMMRRLRSEASEKDPEGGRCLLGLAGPETFEHEGHLALVFQLQKCDMRSGLRKYGQGFGLPLVTLRAYAVGLFQALRALSKIKVIHSDVKPDNLLMSLDKASVRLSDFGSAMTMEERIKSDSVQPRFYRAPEVILGQQYNPAIDMWSAGCTMFEFASGQILFGGRTNNEMLHEMLKTCGAFPKRFATTGEWAGKHFDSNGNFRQHPSEQKRSSASGDHGASSGELLPMERFPRPAQPTFAALEAAATAAAKAAAKAAAGGGEAGAKAATAAKVSKEDRSLLQHVADLVSKCLTPNPAERLTPEGALSHRFLRRSGVSSAH